MSPPQKIQKTFLLNDRDPLSFVSQDNEIIPGIQVKDLPGLGRDHDLPLVAHLDNAEDVLALGRNCKPQAVFIPFVEVYEVIYRHTEHFGYLPALLDIRQGLPGLIL